MPRGRRNRRTATETTLSELKPSLATFWGDVTRNTVIWISAALLGIVLTAALAWSASQLAGQRIGLSSEPLSALGALAPPPPARHTVSRRGSPAPATHRRHAVATASPPGPMSLGCVRAARAGRVDCSGAARFDPGAGHDRAGGHDSGAGHDSAHVGGHDGSGGAPAQPALGTVVKLGGGKPAGRLGGWRRWVLGLRRRRRRGRWRQPARRLIGGRWAGERPILARVSASSPRRPPGSLRTLAIRLTNT